MESPHSIQTIRKRKQRIYSVVLSIGIVVVGLVWISAELAISASRSYLIRLPLIILALLVLLLMNRRIERLRQVEYGTFILTFISPLISLADAMLKEPLNLVALGDMFYWIPIVYLMGFLVLKAPYDAIVLSSFLLLTISTGFLHFTVHDFSRDGWPEILFLIRFYLSQITIFAVSFSLFRMNEEMARLKGAKDTWEDLALTDSLTGLGNRMALAAELDRELAQVRRYKHVSSVLMMDVDDFKRINDRFGHPEGDEVLAKVAQAISANLREVDVATRYAGDEFVLILPETSESEARSAGLRIQQAVRVLENGQPLKLEMSFGVTELDAEMTSDKILRQVDERLYEAKGLR